MRRTTARTSTSFHSSDRSLRITWFPQYYFRRQKSHYSTWDARLPSVFGLLEIHPVLDGWDEPPRCCKRHPGHPHNDMGFDLFTFSVPFLDMSSGCVRKCQERSLSGRRGRGRAAVLSVGLDRSSVRPLQHAPPLPDGEEGRTGYPSARPVAHETRYTIVGPDQYTGSTSPHSASVSRPLPYFTRSVSPAKM